MPLVGVDTTGSSNVILSAALGAIRMPPERFKALDVAPRWRVKGSGLSAEWPERTDRDDLDEGRPELFLQPVSEMAPAHTLGMDYTPKSDTLERYPFAVPLADTIVAHWETTNSVDMRSEAMIKAATHVANVLERKVMTLITTNGSYGTTTDPGNYNTTSTSLISPIRTAIQTIIDDNGTVPNKALVDSATADQLILIDEVQAHASRGHGTSVPGDYGVLSDFFRQRFGLELIIHQGKYRSGSTQTSYVPARISIFDGDPNSPRPFLRTLVNEMIPEGVDGVASVEEIRTQNPNATTYIAQARFKARVMFSTAGYALTGVLS